MSPSKQHFLFLLIFTFIVRSQVLNPLSNCLGNCMHCAPGDLSLCKGPLSCEWGYYINSPNGTCTLAPSKELVWSQLGERTTKNTAPISESWGDSTKQIACEYNSPSGKKYIDALGLFGGVTMLEKTFFVNNNSRLFELSFNLLRDEWMPFNDFLLIDISSKDETIQSLEISYEERIKVESQQTPILCGNKRVISQKYNVKIHNSNDIGNSLTIVFTSFLYLSQWGLSNIKLLSACTHFSLYDQNTESCSICDTDSYLATLYDGEKMCDKCPSLCKTCSSKSNCTTCLYGATLNKNGTCSFASGFKTQQIVSSAHSLNTCSSHQFYLSNSAKKITYSDIKNEENLLYDEIQLHFKIYYHPRDWLTSSTDRISIKINKVEVFSLNKQNLTNKGTISCKAFKSNTTAVLQILTPHKIQNDNSIILEIEYIGKNKDLQFGVSDVSVKSLKKEAPAINISIPIVQDKITVPDVKPSINVPVSNIAISSKPPVDESLRQVNTSLVANKTEPINTTNATNNTIPSNSTANASNHVEIKTKITNASIINIEPAFNTTQNSKNDSHDKDTTIVKGITEPPVVKEEISVEQTKKPLLVINESPDIEQSKRPQEAAIQKIIQQPKTLTKNESTLQTIKAKQATIVPIGSQTTEDTATKPIIFNNSGLTEIQQAQPEQTTVSSKAAYIPTSNNDHSGLHVVISNVPSLANSSLRVSIDKLDPNSYELSETYIQDSDLHLFIAIDSSFIDGKMTVYKVSPSRLLQTASKGNSQIIAVVSIDRYDSLSSNQLLSINTFSAIFQIFAWIGVISIIIATLSGYGIVVEEYIMSLQLLFLHVYIAADYLPLTFRDVIGGLNRLQNLDFMILSHGAQIEKSWLGNVIQNGPIKFFLFNTDINFTREFYPIIIINIAYAIWFIGLYLSKRFLLRQDLIDQEKPALYRIIENIVCRPINYLDQIWRYQFLATMWCCFIQFYNLTYPQGSNRSEIINALLCVLALVCSLGWPVFLGSYSRKYFYENEYSDFLYRFEDVYFGRIHECFLPSSHTRIGFPIVRSAKLLFSAIIIAYFGNIASLTLLLLVGLQIFEVGYAKHHEIFIDHKYFAHRLIENVLFALIQLILFFLCTFSSLALTESYVYIGFVLSGMALVIVLNSVARAVHLGCQKYRKMFEDMNWEADQMEKPKTERIV